MKKIILTFLLFLSFIYVRSQSSQNWQNAILRADGLTEIDGVEAFCMKTSCNNEDIVLIKFVNKNEYKVRLEWKDAIYVNGTWFYSKNSKPKVFYLDPGSDISGQCNGELKLKVNISSIINNPNDFGHFTVSGLTINK